MTTTVPYPQLPQSQSKLWQVKANQPPKPVLLASQTEQSAQISPQTDNADPAVSQPAWSLLITSVTHTFLHVQKIKSLGAVNVKWQAPQFTHDDAALLDGPSSAEAPSMV